MVVSPQASSAIITMASHTTPKTLALSNLQAYLEELGAPTPVPTFPSANPVHNPNDVYRLYIAAVLEKLIDCDRVLLYESLQRPSTLSKGDLVLVLPRLRLKGVKPSDLGVELASKAWELVILFYRFFPLIKYLIHT
jgi:arginyl-tRNA synthetase